MMEELGLWRPGNLIRYENAEWSQKHAYLLHTEVSVNAKEPHPEPTQTNTPRGGV